MGRAHQFPLRLPSLSSLLEPVGHHRRTHIQPSQGKRRARKRKRQASTAPVDSQQPPPFPAISHHLLVGLNSVTRHLSALAGQTAPPRVPAASTQGLELEDEQSPEDDKAALRPLSLVILPHPVPSSSLAHAHLPALVYLSSTRSKTAPPTRLVTLPTASEARLASILHLPRVGALGIMAGAPDANGLVDYVRSNFGLVECKWIEESLKAEWKGVKTDT